MNGSLAACIWPLARVGDALQALARKSGFAVRQAEIPAAPAERMTAEETSDWIIGLASWLRLEAEPVECPYWDVESLFRRAAPALVHLPGAEPGFVALLGGGRDLRLLSPDGEVRRLPVAAVRDLFTSEMEAPHREEIDGLLHAIGVAPRRRERARRAMLRERLLEDRLEGCWLLHEEPGSLAGQVKQAKLARYLVGLLAVYFAQYALWLLSWWLLGHGALNDRFDPGWLSAWVLLLMTVAPLSVLATWWGGVLAIRAGALLKVRLLVGALRLEPDEIRHQGIGQLLGRVLESEVVETLGVNGAVQGLLVLLELGLAAMVIAAGPNGGLCLAALALWLVLSGLLFLRYYQRRKLWTALRLDQTHALVEKMVGHRTRLAQESRASLHDGEDEALAAYLERSRKMDRLGAALVAIVPRGYLLLGILALLPTFLSSSNDVAGDVTGLAVGVGGTLLAYRALHRLAEGLSAIAGASISFRQVSDLFSAARRTEAPGRPDMPLMANGQPPGAKLLDVRQVVFRHQGRSQPVLREASLELHRGDRLLLEGPSGSGKSTLAAILAGLRSPDSGLVLLRNLDRQTLGLERWRRRVVLVPQFHENHILTGTLAFNLLMGCEWPPRDIGAEFRRAEAVCRGLDLGPLLDRMPSGLIQMVGETGWQLSHGERSRVYLARALLQGGEVILLDESFGALDPETLERAMTFVRQQATTLVVIAHP